MNASISKNAQDVVKSVVDGDVDFDLTLMNAGGDSFSAVSISDRLYRECGLSVSPESLLTEGTLNSVIGQAEA
ncbi:acyl carrier protein [Corynebacterium glyciniphilum]|uniref:acyl carrier protein n=1 Tax=Corynebacterium glyciniphilum TaxID=1404244 RepID=UPI0034E98A6C